MRKDAEKISPRNVLAVLGGIVVVLLLIALCYVGYQILQWWQRSTPAPSKAASGFSWTT